MRRQNLWWGLSTAFAIAMIAMLAVMAGVATWMVVGRGISGGYA